MFSRSHRPPTASEFREVALRRNHMATIQAYRRMCRPDSNYGDIDQLWMAIVVQRSLQSVEDEQVRMVAGTILERNVDWVRRIQIGQIIFGGEYPNVVDHFDAALDLFRFPLRARSPFTMSFESFPRAILQWHGRRPFHLALAASDPERFVHQGTSNSVNRWSLDGDGTIVGYRVDLEVDTSERRYSVVRDVGMITPKATYHLTRSNPTHAVRGSAPRVWSDVTDTTFAGTWHIDSPNLPPVPASFESYLDSDSVREVLRLPLRERRVSGRYRWWNGRQWTGGTFNHVQGVPVDWNRVALAG